MLQEGMGCIYPGLMPFAVLCVNIGVLNGSGGFIYIADMPYLMNGIVPYGLFETP